MRMKCSKIWAVGMCILLALLAQIWAKERKKAEVGAPSREWMPYTRESIIAELKEACKRHEKALGDEFRKTIPKNPKLTIKVFFATDRFTAYVQACFSDDKTVAHYSVVATETGKVTESMLSQMGSKLAEKSIYLSDTLRASIKKIQENLSPGEPPFLITPCPELTIVADGSNVEEFLSNYSNEHDAENAVRDYQKNFYDLLFEPATLKLLIARGKYPE